MRVVGPRAHPHAFCFSGKQVPNAEHDTKSGFNSRKKNFYSAKIGEMAGKTISDSRSKTDSGVFG